MKQTKAEHIIEAMLRSDRPSSYWTAGTFSFAELEQAVSTQQRLGTVFSHTMDALDGLQYPNSITLLAVLFHDLGKIKTKVITSGIVNFPNHEHTSSVIALDTMQEWETDPYVMDRVIRIVKTHMIDIRSSFSDQAIRNFIAKVGHDNIDNWFAVRRADAISYFGKDTYVTKTIGAFEKQIHSRKYRTEFN